MQTENSEKRSLDRVARCRSAKPFTPVRIRKRPPRGARKRMWGKKEKMWRRERKDVGKGRKDVGREREKVGPIAQLNRVLDYGSSG